MHSDHHHSASAVSTEQFYVVTGIDGSGRSTVLHHMAKRHPEWIVGAGDPHEWLPHHETPHLDWAVKLDPKLLFRSLSSHTRASMLLSVITSYWEYWIAPRLRANEIVVVDSYYYLHYAKERVYGAAPKYFFDALESLPQPGRVLLLDIPPQDAARRKKTYAMHEVDTETSTTAFVRFQSAVHRQLDHLCRKVCPRLETLDATHPPAEVATQAMALIGPRRLRESGN